MNEPRYFCPCCGHAGLHQNAYSELPTPPFGALGEPPYIGRYGDASFGCCACCGFEFGYDDDAGASGRDCSFQQWLKEFVEGGCSWFYPESKPGGWNLQRQLHAAGLAPPDPARKESS